MDAKLSAEVTLIKPTWMNGVYLQPGTYLVIRDRERIAYRRALMIMAKQGNMPAKSVLKRYFKYGKAIQPKKRKPRSK